MIGHDTIDAIVNDNVARGARLRFDHVVDSDARGTPRCGQEFRRSDLACSQSAPWKIGTFELLNDPRFEEKPVDVVGLDLDPPERPVVFSFDEKTQCQAAHRTPARRRSSRMVAPR